MSYGESTTRKKIIGGVGVKRIFLLLLILSFFCYSFLFSQESITVIEKAYLSRGTALIKIFNDITTLKALFYAEVTITGIVVEDYETSEKYRGVRFSYYKYDKYGSDESSVFLDLDESIEAIQVIANMRKIYDSVIASNVEYFEVSYNSNGGLETTMYKTEKGPRIAIKIGLNTAFFEIDRITDIVLNIQRAVEWLNSK